MVLLLSIASPELVNGRRFTGPICKIRCFGCLTGHRIGTGWIYPAPFGPMIPWTMAPRYGEGEIVDQHAVTRKMNMQVADLDHFIPQTRASGITVRWFQHCFSGIRCCSALRRRCQTGFALRLTALRALTYPFQLFSQ